MAFWNADGSASSGVISLKRIPGLGKSGMSRIYFASSMTGSLVPWVVVKEYELKEGEATMPLTIRPAAPADLDVIVEFNRLLAEESEGKVLNLSQLRPGVAAGLSDPKKGT